MDGAIYVLSRRVDGDHGESYTQNVTVFASSPTEARALVAEQFAQVRRTPRSPERPYQPDPPWSVEKIQLDQHKVLTAGITQ